MGRFCSAEKKVLTFINLFWVKSYPLVFNTWKYQEELNGKCKYFLSDWHHLPRYRMIFLCQTCFQSLILPGKYRTLLNYNFYGKIKYFRISSYNGRKTECVVVEIVNFEFNIKLIFWTSLRIQTLMLTI